jgi:RHS repeat-associated protein
MGITQSDPRNAADDSRDGNHMFMRTRTTTTAALTVLVFGLLLNSRPQIAEAHDFGGDTSGAPSDPAPPAPPPCDNECGCDGPGASSSIVEKDELVPQACPLPDEPPNRSCQPISYWNGGESIVEQDMKLAGAMPILLMRKYDSLSAYDSPLGYGWVFLHDRRLYEYPDGSIVVRYGCGNRDRYIASGGAFTSPVGGMLGTLIHNPDGSWSLNYTNGTRDQFDSLGRLAAFTNATGSRHEFSYDAAGRLPLTGTSKASVTPGSPMVVAQTFRLTRIEERGADGALTGRFVTFSYNATTGRLASASANDGRSVSYVHDTTAGSTKGNLVQVTGLTGIVQTYEYADLNDEHNLTSLTRATGRTPIVNTYDAQDRVTRQDEGTRRIEFNYQIPLAKTVVTRTIRDQNGLNPYTALATYEFDTTGRITKIIDALGHERRYIYNAAKRLERAERWQKSGATLSLLQSVNFAYDTAGHTLSRAVTLDSGEIITRTWTYDHDWIATEQTVSSAAPGKLFRTEYTFRYDTDGKPKNIEQRKRRRDDGSFQTTVFTYDALNRLLTTTFPDSAKLVNEYTGDQLTKTYYEVSGAAVPQLTRRFDYDAAGNLTKQWDARNNLAEATYDDLGRKVTVTNPLGQQIVISYSDELISQVEIGRTVADGEGVVRRVNYDSRGNIIAIQRKDGSGTLQTYESYELDSEGQRLATTDALGRKTEFAYDLLGRQISVTDPLNNVTQFGYDAAGNRTSLIDALGRQTVHEFDDLNREVAVAQSGVSPEIRHEFSYDAVGNMVSMKDGENHTTVFQYDALSRRTQTTQPLGQVVQNIYDARDRLERIITARGQKIDFSFEPWGPKKAEKYYPTVSATTADRIISYAYDNDGNVTGIADDAIAVGSVYSNTYDALGRIFDETVKYLPGGDKVLNHRYDRYGNRKELTFNDGASVSSTYVYDKLNRLESATLAGAAIGITRFANDDISVISLPGSLTRSFTYDTNGPIESITVNGPSGQIAQLEYAYDDVLDVDTITDADGIHDYDYDGVRRLTAAIRPAGHPLPNESYTYDRDGNREDPASAALYAYDANNRISASPGLSYGFDADGNISTRSDGATFSHDSRNRLVAFTQSTTTATYLHDAAGRRVRKTVNGVSVWYLWDGQRLLAEYSGSGVRQKRYAYIEPDHAPLQMEDANGVHYVHADHVDAPRIVTNSTAQIAWRARYAAFGVAVTEEDVDGNSVPVTLNVRFPGQYADAESGLYYNLFRDYSPTTGRYVQADPIGIVGGNNLYAYANGNPLTYFDSQGLAPEALCEVCKGNAACELFCKACIKGVCQLSPGAPVCCYIEKDECIAKHGGTDEAGKCGIELIGCLTKNKGGKKPPGPPEDI